MMEKIYRDADVDLAILKGKTLAVIGYGIQGKAQAANCRDSGCRVIIGTRPASESPSHDHAAADGFDVMSVADATLKADVLLIELADPVQPAVYKRDIAPHLRTARPSASVMASACFMARSNRQRMSMSSCTFPTLPAHLCVQNTRKGKGSTDA